MKKIAFCFLIYGSIHHEELWHIFFSHAAQNKYSIYIHYKYNEPLQYFEKFKLPSCMKTNYWDITIPLAYNLLFREAYKDENNVKFVILSGACIPLKSFDFIYTTLTSDDYGHFNVCPPSDCFPNCQTLLKSIEKKFISKSHNWFILNRKLVEHLCSHDMDIFLKKHYHKIDAPAEYFYYTRIRMLNLEDEIKITHNESNHATTFTNWQDMDYTYVTDDRLKNYSTITKEELLYLLESKCLFGRKFNKECFPSLYNVQEYIDVLTTNGF